MSCKGLHCNGCSGGGGKVAVIVALVLVIAAIGKAAGRAAAEAGHILAVALEVAVIGLAVLAAVGAVGALSWVGLKVYRWHSSRRPRLAVGVAPSASAFRAEVVSSGPQAIEAPKPRLTGVPCTITEEVTDDYT